LNAAERNYAMLEKESLSNVSAVKRLYQYLKGTEFVLIADIKPFVGMLCGDQSIPPMAASRMQRWAFLLSGFDYRLVYKKTS
jgi:hypothetical protein